jgi:hypothetical protein
MFGLARGTFEINWGYVVFAAIASTSLLGTTGWFITDQYLQQDPARPMPDDLTLSLVLGIWVFIVASLVGLTWICYCHWAMVIDEEGISKPTIRGWRRIRWSQVHGISPFILAFHIHGPQSMIAVSPYLFRRPDDVIVELDRLARPGQQE